MAAVFLCVVYPVQAVYDPLSVPNNRFGMHIIDENDLDSAAKLVNSSGGDWGYVQLVIQEDDRNIEKWQNILNRMRVLHIIPLLRLATHVEGDHWVKPRENDIGSWVDFLDSLHWVSENRYIIVFNEPNHAKEWGNDINPAEYAHFLKEFFTRLKARSEDFFILPAGMDASASDGPDTQDESEYIKQMVDSDSSIFTYIDGWASHSYPNPNFSGSPEASGRGTIQTFRWELNLISNWTNRSFPVFITETGWKHSQGRFPDGSYATPDTVANYYNEAFSSVWVDSRIAAVVPFLLNYQDVPFDHFSWRKFGSSDYYPMYSTVASLTKNAGAPKQHLSARIYTGNLPDRLIINSDYSIPVEIENTGQAIIGSTDDWTVELAGLPASFHYLVSNIDSTQPFQRTRIDIRLKTPKDAGFYHYSVRLKRKSETVAEIDSQFALIPPPSLSLFTKTWLNRLANGNDFSLLFYDREQKLVHKEENISFVSGIATVENLVDIIPRQTYRLVLLRSHYLPRQVITSISETETAVVFPPLLPFDPDDDGAFTLNDILYFFQKSPYQALRQVLAM